MQKFTDLNQTFTTIPHHFVAFQGHATNLNGIAQRSSCKSLPAEPTSDFGVFRKKKAEPTKNHRCSSTFQMSTPKHLSEITPVPCTSTMEMSKPLAPASCVAVGCASRQPFLRKTMETNFADHRRPVKFPTI